MTLFDYNFTMKTHIQKEMRKIRLELKKHDISENEKIRLRQELEELRVLLLKEKEVNQ